MNTCCPLAGATWRLYICVYAYKYVGVAAVREGCHKFICIYVYARIYIWIYNTLREQQQHLHICMHKHIYTYIYMCSIFMCSNTCIFIRIYIIVHIGAYLYIHMHAYTFVNAYIKCDVCVCMLWFKNWSCSAPPQHCQCAAIHYGGATISRLLNIIGLFAKEPYKRDDILQRVCMLWFKNWSFLGSSLP